MDWTDYYDMLGKQGCLRFQVQVSYSVTVTPFLSSSFQRPTSGFFFFWKEKHGPTLNNPIHPMGRKVTLTNTHTSFLGSAFLFLLLFIYLSVIFVMILNLPCVSRILSQDFNIQGLRNNKQLYILFSFGMFSFITSFSFH